jgi:hypothetical protein
LQGELSAADNLRFEGEDRSVIFAPESAALKLFAPVGALIWEQKRVPLNLTIQKAEGIDLGGQHTLTVHIDAPPAEIGRWGGTPEMDQFGVGTFLNLSDAEALNLSRFEQQQSGLRIDAAGAASSGQSVTVIPTPALIKIPGRSRLLDLIAGLYGVADMYTMLSERNGSARLNPGEPQVVIKQETWNVHSGDGQQKNAPLNAVQAFSQAKRSAGAALPAVEQAVDLRGVF